MATRYPRVLIVDAPVAAPGRMVLYDFQDDTQSAVTGSKTQVESAAWSFGQLDLLGDPDAVGVQWALQRLALEQIIRGPKAAAMSRLVSMSRALMGQRFWVEFQLTASTAPVWWHAYRTPPGELKLDQVITNGSNTSGPSDGLDRWRVSGGIDVDPFSYAARVTVPTQTVGNNPANNATAPATGFSLPTLKGDGATGLRVKIANAAAQGAGTRWLVAATTTAALAVPFRQSVGTGDAFGNSTLPITTTYADAVGGSSRSGSADSIGAAATLDGTITATRGRWLLLARAFATAGATITYVVTPSGATMPTLVPPVTATFPTTAAQWVPLGTIAVGNPVPADVASTDGGGATSATSLRVTMTATVSSHLIGVDDLLLVPVSGDYVTSSSTLILDFQNGPSNGNATPAVLDADTEVTWVGGLSPNRIVQAGGYPVATPAANAVGAVVLLVLPMRDPGPAGSAITRLANTADVTVSYQPRSAWIGDGT